MDDALKIILAEVPFLRGRQAEIKALSGGLTNRNYLLNVEDQSYVLRIAGEGTDLLGIDREREVACSRAAEAAGVGPEVVAYLPQHQALVCRFLPGKLLAAEDTLNTHVLGRIAKALRRCHGHPVPAGLGTFSPFATVRNYYCLARERKVPLPEELDEALTLLDRFELELVSNNPACLCHNDLLPANFIDDGQSVRIIDWEYGGLGDRFFDLGNLAVNLQWTPDQETAFLIHYFGAARPEHLHRLRLMRLASDLREALWGFVQAALSQLHPPGHFLDYGNKHLQRFLSSKGA